MSTMNSYELFTPFFDTTASVSAEVHADVFHYIGDSCLQGVASSKWITLVELIFYPSPKKEVTWRLIRASCRPVFTKVFSDRSVIEFVGQKATNRSGDVWACSILHEIPVVGQAIINESEL